MLKEERQNWILNKLHTSGKVVVSHLAGELKVSEDTILDHAFATRVNSGILSDSGLSLEELYIIKKIFAEKYH